MYVFRELLILIQDCVMPNGNSHEPSKLDLHIAKQARLWYVTTSTYV